MEPIDVARAYLEAWNRHDSSAIRGLFHDGATYRDPAAGTLVGEAIAAYADSLFAAFRFLGHELATGGMTSVWVPLRINLWLRCESCGAGPGAHHASARARRPALRLCLALPTSTESPTPWPKRSAVRLRVLSTVLPDG